MRILFTLFMLLILKQSCKCQIGEKWFDKESILATVSLEKEVNGKFTPHGTGFVVLQYKTKDDIIVTCEHLLRNNSIYVTIEVNEEFRNMVRSLPSIEQKKVLQALNPDSKILWNIKEDFMRIKVNLVRDSTFFVHPDGLDVGAFKVNLPTELIKHLSTKDSTFKVTNIKRIGVSRIANKQNINLGDDCYFIGFPFGIGSPQSTPSPSNYTASAPKHLLRKGTVSWLSNDYDDFLIDALSFGGNSGSPIFQVVNEAGKPPFYLMGIIIGHLSDINTNANFGLARCISSSEIIKVIKLADR